MLITTLIGRLSSDIDFQYEIEQEEIHLNDIIALEKEREEYSLAIIDNDNDDLNSTLISENDVNQSHNRSDLTHITKQTCKNLFKQILLSSENQT